MHELVLNKSADKLKGGARQSRAPLSPARCARGRRDKLTPPKCRECKKAREGAETPAEPLWRFPRFSPARFIFTLYYPRFSVCRFNYTFLRAFSPVIPHLFVRNFTFSKFYFFPPAFKTFAKYRQENTGDFASFDDKK